MELDYQENANVGAAVYDAINRPCGKQGTKGVDTSIEDRKLIGERVARRLGDYGLKIVRDK